MRLTYSTSEALHFIRHSNQMNMIGHQTLRQERKTVPATLLLQETQVGSATIIGEEDAHRSHAALRNVMGYARQHHPCNPSHVAIVSTRKGVFKLIYGFSRYGMTKVAKYVLCHRNPRSQTPNSGSAVSRRIPRWLSGNSATPEMIRTCFLLPGYDLASYSLAATSFWGKANAGEENGRCHEYDRCTNR